jgi:hypothetical protein
LPQSETLILRPAAGRKLARLRPGQIVGIVDAFTLQAMQHLQDALVPRTIVRERSHVLRGAYARNPRKQVHDLHAMLAGLGPLQPSLHHHIHPDIFKAFMASYRASYGPWRLPHCSGQAPAGMNPHDLIRERQPTQSACALRHAVSTSSPCCLRSCFGPSSVRPAVLPAAELNLAGR